MRERERDRQTDRRTDGQTDRQKIYRMFCKFHCFSLKLYVKYTALNFQIHTLNHLHSLLSIKHIFLKICLSENTQVLTASLSIDIL